MMGTIALAFEAIKMLGVVIKWWVGLDERTRSEIRLTWKGLEDAEKSGKQSNMRSAINRLNANL